MNSTSQNSSFSDKSSSCSDNKKISFFSNLYLHYIRKMSTLHNKDITTDYWTAYTFYS